MHVTATDARGIAHGPLDIPPVVGEELFGGDGGDTHDNGLLQHPPSGLAHVHVDAGRRSKAPVADRHVEWVLARVQATCGPQSPIRGGHGEKLLLGGGRGGSSGRRWQTVRECVVRVVIGGMDLAQVTTAILILGG